MMGVKGIDFFFFEVFSTDSLGLSYIIVCVILCGEGGGVGGHLCIDVFAQMERFKAAFHCNFFSCELSPASKCGSNRLISL